MTFYAEFLNQTSRVFIAVDSPSMFTAVALCEAFAYGYQVGTGEIVTFINLTSTKPRGKSYFKLSDADSIRRGLEL